MIENHRPQVVVTRKKATQEKTESSYRSLWLRFQGLVAKSEMTRLLQKASTATSPGHAGTAPTSLWQGQGGSKCHICWVRWLPSTQHSTRNRLAPLPDMLRQGLAGQAEGVSTGSLLSLANHSSFQDTCYRRNRCAKSAQTPVRSRQSTPPTAP